MKKMRASGLSRIASYLAIITPREMTIILTPVVRMIDNSIQRINRYPVDSVVCFANTYPLDSNLSDG